MITRQSLYLIRNLLFSKIVYFWLLPSTAWSGQTIYTNTFESSITEEWTLRRQDSLPTIQNKFLGLCTGQRPWLGAHAAEACECRNRLLTRSASNAYFPQALSVISIPDNRSGADETVASLWEAHFSTVADQQELAYEMRKPPVRAVLGSLSADEVWASIERIRAGIKKAVDVPVKDAEFEVLNEAKPELGSDVPDGDFFARILPRERWDGSGGGTPNPLMNSVDKVVLVHRLREVVALLGFTRFESLGADVNGELPDELSLAVKPASLSLNSSWLPAIESRGEGIFTVLNGDEVEKWARKPEVLSRGAVLAQGFKQWQGEHANKTRQFMASSTTCCTRCPTA